jgi:hypothetical protein
MKFMPAPGTYTPKKSDAIKGNVRFSMDRISYLDQAIRDKQESVGPGHYIPKVGLEYVFIFIRETLYKNDPSQPSGLLLRKRTGTSRKTQRRLIWEPTMCRSPKNL